jgi:large subunit ribosomal protein L5
MPERSTEKPEKAAGKAGAHKPDKQGGPKADKQSAAKADKQGAPKADKPAETPTVEESGPAPPARLHEFYRNEVVAQLRSELKLSNPMQVPRIAKITVNMGVGEALADRKVIDAAAGDLAKISGQKPKICRARKAVASFKVREGVPIGCMVTLRGARMYEFLDRLINIAMPRIRDFRGLSPRGFDGRGNYSFGVREQIIFPEIQYDAIDQLRGMDITITTTARDNKQGRALLEAFRFPFRR